MYKPSYPSPYRVKVIKYVFNNPEEFAKMKRLAYDGQLDFNRFPAAEYRYFDTLQDIGYRVRHEGYPKDLARADCDKAFQEYEDDIRVLSASAETAKRYNESRVRMGGLVAMINKERSPMDKLRLALEFVELTVGEDGLARRNLSNYLEQSPRQLIAAEVARFLEDVGFSEAAKAAREEFEVNDCEGIPVPIQKAEQ